VATSFYLDDHMLKSEWVILRVALPFNICVPCFDYCVPKFFVTIVFFFVAQHLSALNLARFYV
jgi:hypothetical protein